MGAPSLTAEYFQKMGFEVKYYMASGMVAPLAFYHQMNGLESRPPMHLTLLIAVMDTIQKIYRPEIYATNEPEGDYFTPSLHNPSYSRMPIYYDCDERDVTLIARQAKYVRDNFLVPYQDQLKQLAGEYSIMIKPERTVNNHFRTSEGSIPNAFPKLRLKCEKSLYPTCTAISPIGRPVVSSKAFAFCRRMERI